MGGIYSCNLYQMPPLRGNEHRKECRCMEELTIKQLPEYQLGYSRGYHDGYAKAMLHFQNMIATTQNPRIIVTTQENLEKIKQEYGID
jgi:flagellar biosynthesis/type III secretory pathway protein FliH